MLFDDEIVFGVWIVLLGENFLRICWIGVLILYLVGNIGGLVCFCCSCFSFWWRDWFFCLRILVLEVVFLSCCSFILKVVFCLFFFCWIFGKIILLVVWMRNWVWKFLLVLMLWLIVLYIDFSVVIKVGCFFCF